MSNRRIPEIDIFRSLALVLMILYHLIYDLDQWTQLALDVKSPFWFIIGKAAALLFIFLSGFSSGLSKQPVKNGHRVLFYAMIITVVTYIAFPEQYIRFGILHFLGIMMLLYPLLQKLPNPALLLLALLSIALGFYLESQLVDTPLLLPLGLRYSGFSTMDFYPLFPYSGVTLLGILGYRYYLTKTSHKKNPQKKAAPPFFTWVSRHSLAIYLIHQPILLGVLFVLKGLGIIS